MALSITNPQPTIQVNGNILKTTKEFTYLGSIVKNVGGADKDIRNRISKARYAFNMLNNIWKSQQYSIKTKLKLYQSCILSTLLYASECWRMTKDDDLDKVSVFHTKSLRRILRIFWPNKISNEELLRRCEQEGVANILMKRRWRWIGHVLRRDKHDNARIALYWTPEGKRKRGRPKITWRRTVMEEVRAVGETLNWEKGSG